MYVSEGGYCVQDTVDIGFVEKVEALSIFDDGDASNEDVPSVDSDANVDIDTSDCDMMEVA